MPFYNVYSATYLVTFFVFALIETLLCSGITYGWASIVVVFKMEYFYFDLCKGWYAKHNVHNKTTSKSDMMFLENRTIVGGGAGFFNDGKLPGCPAQDSMLNLIFTVSLFCLCGIKFPAGVFIDRFGPRVARIVGGSMYITAAISLGFVAIGYENLLFPIFALICMGGSLLVVAVYQVSNIVFRRSRCRVMCILHGAFDSSAVLLLVFKLRHDQQRLNREKKDKLIYETGIQFKYIMFVYAGICLLLVLLGTFVLIPPLHVLFRWVDEENEMTGRIQYESIVGPDFAVRSLSTNPDFYNVSINYGTYGGNSGEKNFANNSYQLNKQHLSGEWEYNPMDTDDEEDEIVTSVVENSKDGQVLVKSMQTSSYFARGSVLRAIFSKLYMFELVFLLTFQLKLWYFVGSLTDYLERLTLNDKNLVSEYINLFGYIQFGGIFITPIIGLMFDKDKIGKTEVVFRTPSQSRLDRLQTCIIPFTVTNILCLLLCVVSLIENLKLQIFSFILYTTVRGFLYANHGAFMGAAFPASQFGTLYGLGIFVGGCFGLFQYALFELTSGPLYGDPFWTNIILLVLAVLGNIHPVHLWWYCREEDKRLKRKQSAITN